MGGKKSWRPAFAASHLSMTLSTYLIVAATTERYLSRHNLDPKPMTGQQRAGLAGAAVAAALLAKGPVYWEYDVIHLHHCKGLAQYAVGLSSLSSNPWYTSSALGTTIVSKYRLQVQQSLHVLRAKYSDGLRALPHLTLHELPHRRSHQARFALLSAAFFLWTHLRAGGPI